MKPAIVADEMFPEGAGPYMDIEEAVLRFVELGLQSSRHPLFRLPGLKGQAGGSSALLMDLAANEKSVHADFYNDFEDLFDDEDLA